jgi:outer membrane protein OmpA-like peptidoglycan-associated protein
MKFIFCILFSFLATSFYAQKTFTVYFDTNSHQLSLSELSRLDKNFKNKNVDILTITGFCDDRATNGHNDSLAENRAKFVGNLLKKLVNASKYQIISKGENFNQSTNLAENRKVVISYNEFNSPKKNELETDLSTKISTSKIGDKLVLKNMNFYDRKDIMYPESELVLKQLVTVLKQNPKLKIEIQGHICCTIGKDEEQIALLRCKATYNYLVVRGVNKNQLSYKSFDARQPIFPIPEKAEYQKKANRRVEILIVDK